MNKGHSFGRDFIFYCDRWHWVLLVLASPLLLFPSPTRSPALLIVPGILVLALLAKRTPVPVTPFNLSLLVLSLMVFVSLFATYDVAVSLPKLAGILLGFGTFFAIGRESKSTVGWWISLGVFLAGGAGIVALGFLGTDWLNKLNIIARVVAYLPARITGLPGAAAGFSGNEVAGAVLWVLPLFATGSVFGIARFNERRRARDRHHAVILLVACLAGTLASFAYLALTQSRSGYFGFGAAALTVVSFLLPRRGRWLLAGALVLGGVLWLAALNYSGLGAIQALSGAGPALDPAAAIGTWQGREEIWSRAIYGIQDFPFTGMGMNTFRFLIQRLYPLFFVDADLDIAHAHNEFLQVALDLGIPGLIAFIALYLTAFGMLVQTWRISVQDITARRNDAFRLLMRCIVLGFGAGLAGHVVYSMTEVVALGAKPGVLFWMMLGLIASLYEQARTGRLADWEKWFRAGIPLHWNSQAEGEVRAVD